jgi:hypothetical protein
VIILGSEYTGFLTSNNILDSNISIIDLYGDKHTYKVTGINVETNSITIDEELLCHKVFVYGTEVQDFHILDKSYLYTMNVCATQILSEKVNDLYNIYQSLSTRLASLEAV